MQGSDELGPWLAAAFAGQPGWTVRDQQAQHSFQQQVEHVSLQWPTTGATTEVFLRRYRSQLSWWTLITPDLPQPKLSRGMLRAAEGCP